MCSTRLCTSLWIHRGRPRRDLQRRCLPRIRRPLRRPHRRFGRVTTDRRTLGTARTIMIEMEASAIGRHLAHASCGALMIRGAACARPRHRRRRSRPRCHRRRRSRPRRHRRRPCLLHRRLCRHHRHCPLCRLGRVKISRRTLGTARTTTGAKGSRHAHASGTATTTRRAACARHRRLLPP